MGISNQGQGSPIHKILDILLLFDNHTPYLSIEQISEQLGIPKSTVYRHVRLLCDKGFLEKAHEGNYQLGLTFLKLGRTALNSNRDLRLIAFPSMKRIAEAVRESVSLMRIFNNEVVCIENIEGMYALRVTMEQGRVQPIHAGASPKVILANLPEDEWEQRLKFPLEQFTDTTFVDIEALQIELVNIRERGYAVSDGEVDVGARAIAVPIMNKNRRAIAALSIEGPALRMTDDKLDTYIKLLFKEQEIIHQNL